VQESLFKKKTQPALSKAYHTFKMKAFHINKTSPNSGGRNKKKFVNGLEDIILDFIDVRAWFDAYTTDQSVVHAEVCLSWVGDPDIETAKHTCHFNRSDEPVEEESPTKAQYIVRLVSHDDSVDQGSYEHFFVRPRVAGLTHLGLNGCKDIRTTDEGLDQFKEIKISFSAYTNIVSWRCNRTNDHNDLAARARTAFNTMPNTTFIEDRLHRNDLIMEETWQLVAMHLTNSPWGELVLTKPVK